MSKSTKSKETLSNFLRNKRVLITGAAGSIGSALSRRISELKPKSLIILDQDESGLFDVGEDIKKKCKTKLVIANIREKERINNIFSKYQPDIVFHCAAYKHVSLMEIFPEEAERTNVYGTQVLVDASIKFGVERFIFVSTDKAVNGTSVMGRTKKEGERICAEANEAKVTKFIIVRFGNVMASRGSVVPIFQKQIAEGKNLTITDRRMRRFFMGIYEAVELILRATIIGKAGDIVVLDMGDPISIVELAKLMIKLSGKNLKLEFTKVGKGEKLFEELMTEEEKKRAVKKDGLFIIHTANLPKSNEVSGTPSVMKRVGRDS